jgi:methylenetetrahydrofolate reductase (NADPH)
VTQSQPAQFSFEFFPPATNEGEIRLWDAIRELEPLNPNFVSVTYGAGGSTRDRTLRVTERIVNETKLKPVAHLTCVGSSGTELSEIINLLLSSGVTSLMALRGDPPGGLDKPWEPHPSGFTHAVELVELARELGMKEIGVAAFPDKHPESSSLEFDAEVLAKKQDAGATMAITQLFFKPDSYFALVDRARAHGCTFPIIPGVMPLTDEKQILKFAQLSGSEMPPEILKYLKEGSTEPVEVAKRGVEVATNLSAELLAGGAPGIHFYTMNRSSASREVFMNLQS